MTLFPLNDEPFTGSARKTGRVVIVHEAHRSFGPGAEIIARLVEKAFFYLETPVQRVTGFDVVVPFFAREQAYLPDVAHIVHAAHDIVSHPMAEEFRLPDPGEGIHEAEIVEVCVAAGDTVEEGDIILHIETDKATVEVPSPYAGTVETIKVRPGDVVEVGELLMTFVPQAEAKLGKKCSASSRAEANEAPEQEAETHAVAGKEPAAGRAGRRPVPASPATRRLALELGIDLHEVPARGPGGRVTADDVRSVVERAEEAPEREAEPAAAKATHEEPEVEPRPIRPLTVEPPALPDFSRWGPVEEVVLPEIRRVTARRMAVAWSQIPHVMHQDVADISGLEKFRRRHKADLEQQGGQLSLTVLLLKAVVAVLKQFPRFNASLDADRGRLILKHYWVEPNKGT